MFGFYDYYPEGGLDDIVLTTNDVEEVREHIRWFRTEESTDDDIGREMHNYDNLQAYDTFYTETIYNAYRSINYSRLSADGKKWTKDIIEEVNIMEV